MHAQTWTRAQVHLSREPWGQEVRGLIERPHGATVTLNVQVFISVRCGTLLCYRWPTLNKWEHMENTQSVQSYSWTTVTRITLTESHRRVQSEPKALKYFFFNVHSVNFSPSINFLFVLFPPQTKQHPSTHRPYRPCSFNLTAGSHSFPSLRTLPFLPVSLPSSTQ